MIAPLTKVIVVASPRITAATSSCCPIRLSGLRANLSVLPAGVWAIRRHDRAAGVRSDEMVALAPLRCRGTREAGSVGCRDRLRRWMPRAGGLRRPSALASARMWFMRKLLKKQGFVPKFLVTDKLRSYACV